MEAQRRLVDLSGDEVMAVNGVELSRLTHGDAVAVFKAIKRGRAALLVRRRTTQRRVTAVDDENNCRSVTSLHNSQTMTHT